MTRDFVELPSQINEHWAFEPEVLKVYAKHWQTGEVIPQELVDKLDRSGKYGQGFATTEYLAASLLDMDYFIMNDIPADLDVNAFWMSMPSRPRPLVTEDCFRRYLPATALRISPTSSEADIP